MCYQVLKIFPLLCVVLSIYEVIEATDYYLSKDFQTFDEDMAQESGPNIAADPPILTQPEQQTPVQRTTTPTTTTTTTTTTRPTTMPTTPPVLEPEGISCIEHEGYFKTPGNDPGAYYKCKNGLRDDRHCTKPTEVWKPPTHQPSPGTCVDFPLAGEGKEPELKIKRRTTTPATTTTTTTTSKPTTTPTTPPASKPEVISCVEHEGYFKTPGNDPGAYYECGNGKRIDHHCKKRTGVWKPPTHQPNPGKCFNIPISETDIPRKQRTTTPTTPTTPTTTPTTPTTLPTTATTPTTRPVLKYKPVISGWRSTPRCDGIGFHKTLDGNAKTFYDCSSNKMTKYTCVRGYKYQQPTTKSVPLSEVCVKS